MSLNLSALGDLGSIYKEIILNIIPLGIASVLVFWGIIGMINGNWAASAIYTFFGIVEFAGITNPSIKKKIFIPVLLVTGFFTLLTTYMQWTDLSSPLLSALFLFFIGWVLEEKGPTREEIQGGESVIFNIMDGFYILLAAVFVVMSLIIPAALIASQQAISKESGNLLVGTDLFSAETPEWVNEEFLRMFIPEKVLEVNVSVDQAAGITQMLLGKLHLNAEIPQSASWGVALYTVFLLIFAAYSTAYSYIRVESDSSTPLFIAQIKKVLARMPYLNIDDKVELGYFVDELPTMSFAELWSRWIKNLTEISSAVSELTESFSRLIENAEADEDTWKSVSKSFREKYFRVQRMVGKTLISWKGLAVFLLKDLELWTSNGLMLLGLAGLAGFVVAHFTGINPLALIYPSVLIVLSFWVWRSIELLARRLYSFVIFVAPGAVAGIYNFFFFSDSSSLNFITMAFYGIIATSLISSGLMGNIPVHYVLIVISVLGILFHILFNEFVKILPKMIGAYFIYNILTGILNAAPEGPAGISTYFPLAFMAALVIIFDILVHGVLIFSTNIVPAMYSFLENTTEFLRMKMPIEIEGNMESFLEKIRNQDIDVAGESDKVLKAINKTTKKVTPIAHISKSFFKSISPIAKFTLQSKKNAVTFTEQLKTDSDEYAISMTSDGKVVVKTSDGKGLIGVFDYTKDGLQALGETIGMKFEDVKEGLKKIFSAGGEVTTDKNILGGINRIESTGSSGKAGRIGLGSGMFAKQGSVGFSIQDKAGNIIGTVKNLDDLLNFKNIEFSYTGSDGKDRAISASSTDTKTLFRLIEQGKLKVNGRIVKRVKGGYDIGGMTVKEGQLRNFIKNAGNLQKIARKGVISTTPLHVAKTIDYLTNMGKMNIVKMKVKDSDTNFLLLKSGDGFIGTYKGKQIRGKSVEDIAEQIAKEEGAKTFRVENIQDTSLAREDINASNIEKFFNLENVTDISTTKSTIKSALERFMSPDEFRQLESGLGKDVFLKTTNIDGKDVIKIIRRLDDGSIKESLLVTTNDDVALIEKDGKRYVRFEENGKLTEMEVEKFKKEFENRNPDWVRAIEEREGKLRVVEHPTTSLSIDEINRMSSNETKVVSAGGKEYKVVKAGEGYTLLDENNNLVMTSENSDDLIDHLNILENRKTREYRGAPGIQAEDVAEDVFDYLKGYADSASYVLNFDTLTGKEQIEVIKHKNGKVEIKRNGEVLKTFDKLADAKDWLSGQFALSGLRSEVENIARSTASAEVQAELGSIDARITDLENKLKSGLITRQEFEAEKKKLEKMVQNLAKGLVKYTNMKVSKEVGEVKNEVAAVEGRVTDLETWKSQAEQTLNKLSQNLSDLEGKVPDDLKLQITGILADIQNLQRRKLDRAEFDNEIDDIWKKLIKLEGSVQNLEGDKRDILSAIGKIKGDIGHLRRRVGNVEKEVTGVKGRVTDLETWKSQAEQTLKELKTKYPQLEGEINVILSDIQGLKSGQTDLEQNVRRIQARVAGLTRGLGKLGGRVTRAEKEIKNLSIRTGRAEKRVAGVEKKVTDLETWRKNVVEPSLNAVYNRLSNLENEVPSLKNEINGIKYDIQYLKDNKLNKGEFYISMGSIQRRIQDLKRKIEECCPEKTGLIDWIRDIEKRLDECCGGKPEQPPTGDDNWMADRRVKGTITKEQIAWIEREMKKKMNIPEDLKKTIISTLEKINEGKTTLDRGYKFIKGQLDTLKEKGFITEGAARDIEQIIREHGFVKRFVENYQGTRAGKVPEQPTRYDKTHFEDVGGKFLSKEKRKKKDGTKGKREFKRSTIVLNAGTDREQLHPGFVEAVKGYVTGQLSIKDIEDVLNNTSQRQLERGYLALKRLRPVIKASIKETIKRENPGIDEKGLEKIAESKLREIDKAFDRMSKSFQKRINKKDPFRSWKILREGAKESIEKAEPFIKYRKDAKEIAKKTADIYGHKYKRVEVVHTINNEDYTYESWMSPDGRFVLTYDPNEEKWKWVPTSWFKKVKEVK